MNRIIKAGIAGGIAVPMALGGALLANADDAPPPADPTPTAVTPTDTPAAPDTTTDAPAPTVTDAPAVDPAPTPAADDPANTAALFTVQPDSILTDTGETKTLHWLTTNTSEPTSSTVNWPQTAYPAETCGTGWIQDDVVKYGTDAQKAVVDALDDDNMLTQGEDYGVVISWSFHQQTACPPPLPDPIACTVTGGPYTEDGFPTFTADGLDHEGGSGHALNYLVPTSGNLQGFTGATMTISAANGYQAAYRFVLYANGTSGYTSVSAEPYFNGWVAGQTGVFTITPDTLVWNSHIASGPGSQSAPVSITAMAALIPNNRFISQGTHLGSTAVDGQDTTVSAITGCITYAPPVQPEPTTRQTVVTTDEVCTVNEDGTFPGGGSTTTTTTNYETPFVFDAESNSYVAGDEVQSGDPIVVTNAVAVDEACPATVVVIPPTDNPKPVVNVTPQNTAPLAFTGADTAFIIGAGSLAIALLIVGPILMARAHRRRKDELV